MAIKDTSRKPFIEDNDTNVKIGIDLPIRRDDALGGFFATTSTTIEAVKTVADVYAPISGEIIDSNQSLLDTPELINSNPFDKGWIIKIKLDNSETFPEFMICKEYEDFINKLKNNQQIETDVMNAYNNLLIIQGIYESAKNGGSLINLKT